MPISKEMAEKMLITIQNKGSLQIDICAKNEEHAYELLDKELTTDSLEDIIELKDIDDSDEIDAAERAKARYEEYLEDRAMEEYYERKYGNS